MHDAGSFTFRLTPTSAEKHLLHHVLVLAHVDGILTSLHLSELGGLLLDKYLLDGRYLAVGVFTRLNRL